MAPLITPTSVHEFLRLAHAFLAGSRYPAGSTVYVVASRTAPLRRIQGVYASLADANEAADGPVEARFGWSATEVDSRAVYEMTVPELPYENRVLVIEHPSWTEQVCAPTTDGVVLDLADRPDFNDIESMELRIRAGGTNYRFQIRPDSDAIFITEGAVEMFAYPHYAAVFGHKYVETARRAMRRAGGGDTT